MLIYYVTSEKASMNMIFSIERNISKLFLYSLGSQTGVRVPPGVRKVVQGVRRENISAITESGRNSRNVPFETELQLSDGNIILCIKIAQIPVAGD